MYNRPATLPPPSPPAPSPACHRIYITVHKLWDEAQIATCCYNSITFPHGLSFIGSTLL